MTKVVLGLGAHRIKEQGNAKSVAEVSQLRSTGAGSGPGTSIREMRISSEDC